MVAALAAREDVAATGAPNRYLRRRRRPSPSLHRLLPPPLLSRMVEAGLLGRKSGRGFFEYSRS